MTPCRPLRVSRPGGWCPRVSERMTTRDGIRLRKAGVCWIRYFPGKLAWVLFGLSCLFALCPRAVAKPPVHAEVLVFVPAYEASQLFETDRIDNGQRATSCVWGNYNVFL